MPGWGFRSKLRRAASGWRGSHAAIARIDEAVAEIRSVARSDAVLAAEGAVLLLEKVSSATRRRSGGADHRGGIRAGKDTLEVG
jgi:hypothetical protein